MSRGIWENVARKMKNTFCKNNTNVLKWKWFDIMIKKMNGKKGKSNELKKYDESTGSMENRK